MAEFLTARGASLHIENIIKNAKNRLVIISPFLQIPESLLQNLKDADRRKVKMILIYGKRELNPDERSQLEKLDNLSLHFLENLHAKCFFNEGSMVITSMNLYDFSEQHNREMGVLISARDDKNVFDDAVKETELIIGLSTKIELRKRKDDSFHPRTKRKGYCIRCRTPIPYDSDRPYCSNCFSEWVVWKNPDYKESYCHTCGQPEPASMAKPQCYSCYSKSL